MGDNCGATKYVDGRTKWSLVGDLENETIAKDLNYTMYNFLDAKANVGTKIKKFMDLRRMQNPN